VQEMVDLAYQAFDLADEYRTPVMLLADGMLGQMMEPVVLPEPATEFPDKAWAVTGHHDKREHNIVNSLHLKPEVLEETNIERFERYDRIKATAQRAEEYLTNDADIVVVAFGASSRIARSAVNKARAAGIKVGLVRPITLWPFPVDAIERATSSAKAILVVEMNMGQMVDDVRLAVNGRLPVEFFGRAGGIIPTPAETLAAIERLAEKASAMPETAEECAGGVR
ncbi:MAG: 3-methyl-2-oxobutanoate dehydrogenase subunit beta, partial [Actinobacteria bacterium]